MSTEKIVQDRLKPLMSLPSASELSAEDKKAMRGMLFQISSDVTEAETLQDKDKKTLEEPQDWMTKEKGRNGKKALKKQQ